MGNPISKAMEENMKKQSAVMAEQQRHMLERQAMMQNLMRERQMAMQMGRAREMLYWTGTGGALVLVSLAKEFGRTRNPRFLAPAIPILGVLGYQTDLAYGNKMERIRRMAEDVLVLEASTVALPRGMVTFDEIEGRRQVYSSSLSHPCKPKKHVVPRR